MGIRKASISIPSMVEPWTGFASAHSGIDIGPNARLTWERGVGERNLSCG